MAHASTAMLHLLVIAKAPTPGRVKTRLCPPLTADQAATLAAAALTYTIQTLTSTPAGAHSAAFDG